MLSKIPKVIERFMRECGREQESIVYARESVTQLGLLLESAPTIDSYAIVEPMLMNISTVTTTRRTQMQTAVIHPTTTTMTTTMKRCHLRQRRPNILVTQASSFPRRQKSY